MASEQWARLREDLICGLRRGAWYRVLFAGTNHVAVEVEKGRVFLPRRFLEVVDVRPALWTVVIHTHESFSFPPEYGTHYVVCPSCRERQMPAGRPWALRCQRCNGLYEVDWYEPIRVRDLHIDSDANACAKAG
jgi:hypothetical protein